MFDIVIPLGPNELSRIHQQIKQVKENVIGYRNIYIVSFDPSLQIEDCITIDEKIYEFKITDVASYLKKQHRVGWYYQQLLKLYTGFTIDGILDNYLVIDADVFFQTKLRFIENDKYCFNTSDEYHVPYFQHMNKLHESFKKLCAYSGIAHHMMFNKTIVKEMFDLVENKHHKPFWKIFMEFVDEQYDSGASEYEMYFNYMIQYHSDKIIIRHLRWHNISVHHFNHSYYDKNLNYVSVCHWL
jgi:hypothetical protein